MVKGVLSLLFLFIVAKSFSQQFNAEVTDAEDSYTVKHNVLYESHSYSIKINNAKGDEYATIHIPYLGSSPIYDLEAWIEDTNGKKVRKLKEVEIADRSDINNNNLYDEARVKIFELKYNVYPYIIKYSYCSKRKDFIAICRWSPLYKNDIPTVTAKLTVNIPSKYKVGIYENKTEPPIIDSTGSEKSYIWKETYLHPITPEVYSPPIRELVPFIFIVPLEFNYGVSGSQEDWASYGNWSYNLNKGLDDLPEPEIQKVHELINGISDKKLIIKKLYQYVQDNTRYVSVQVGIGGFKAYSASYAAIQKYGDCKALANYMKALLKVAGISSHWALIYGDGTEARYEVIDKFPSSQFNHVILMVPIEHDTVWLDCTSKTNPVGYLGAFTQNRYALIVDDKNSRLIKTPALTPSNCYTACENNMDIDTSGNVMLTSTITCKGYSFDLSAFYSGSFNKERQKEYINSIIAYKDFEVKQLNIEKPNRDSAMIGMQYRIVLKDNVIQSGRYAFLQLCEPRVPEFENPSKRKYPLRITYPINYIDTTMVDVPATYKPDKPTDENYEDKYGAVNIKYTLLNNKVEVYRRILVKTGEYTTEDYPDFYRFITKLHKTIDTPISFIKNE